ncbi:hypothetical protein TWF718_009200 [Orbilia javanica]|uniref:Uncharacterized protein n=1 Tax=Orbilia javanica TaxID=47235 RepID=A0AAN8MRC3_9PEZI
MIRLLPKKYATKTTQTQSFTAATKVLNIPELLEQILYFVLTSSPTQDTPTICKTANTLRSISPVWAGTIDGSPTLSTLAFRNRKLPPDQKGDLNIPFLQCLRFELSEIEKLRCVKGKAIGLKELKQFKKSQRIPHPKSQRLRRALGLPKYPSSSTKYLASDILLMQPTPEKVSTYIHFIGLADRTWKKWLERSCRQEDLHGSESSVEFHLWHKIVNSDGGGLTGADVVNALIKVLTEFYTPKTGMFEVTRIELAVGRFGSAAPASPVGTEYSYRWYIWNPKKIGPPTDIFDIILKVTEKIIWVAGVVSLAFTVTAEFIRLVVTEIISWIKEDIQSIRRRISR